MGLRIFKRGRVRSERMRGLLICGDCACLVMLLWVRNVWMIVWWRMGWRRSMMSSEL